MKRLLQYINGTLHLTRRLSLKNISEMLIYIDASHAPNDDAKGQTGECISMGTGILHGNSTKQKINTKSSTETELVGASDYLPYALWFLYFMDQQGYSVKRKIFKQDNQSTVKLLKNGKNSTGKQSRHINIRYFWITDRLKQEDIQVEYCPTGLMLADFFTKPLQGSLFRKMRDVVQGVESIEILKPEEKEDPNDVSSNEGEVHEKEMKSLPSCLLHGKERVGKNALKVHFDVSNEMKQDNKDKNKMKYLRYNWENILSYVRK